MSDKVLTLHECLLETAELGVTVNRSIPGGCVAVIGNRGDGECKVWYVGRHDHQDVMQAAERKAREYVDRQRC